MSRGEEMAAVNESVLREALRRGIATRYAGRAAPAEGTAPWIAAAAALADVSVTTVKKMLRGGMVTASLLTTVMVRLKLSAVELVSLEHQLPIPDQPDAYPAYRFGYFISELRTQPGKPLRRWCREQVELRATTGSPGEGLILDGKVTNEFGRSYEVRGRVVGPYLLTLTGTDRETSPSAAGLHRAVPQSFTAVFSRYSRLEGGDVGCGVLFGYWHGVTCFGTPAFYRFFLTTRELTSEELTHLQQVQRAMTFHGVEAGEGSG